MTKILLVEDDAEQQFLFQKVFELKNLPTTIASSVEDVFRVAREDKPEIILLDILLGGENGLDVLEQLKREDDLKNIPVLVLTNTDKKEFRDRAKNLGAVGFITKLETTPQEIAEKVKKILAKNKA
jgi:two-component system phosphate regulon response regulator PhoB